MPYPVELIQAIADRHGLRGELRPMPKGGMVNEAWAIGDGYVLRIVEEGIDEEADAEATREAVVVPLVRKAGITAPVLVAWDTTREFAPRPYTIYERVQGELIGFSAKSYAHYEPAWRRIGEDLAKLHRIDVPESDRPAIYVDKGPDYEKWIGRALDRNAIDPSIADDIRETVSELEKTGGTIPEPRLIHNDLHPWNLMGASHSGELAAIIDWGDTSFGDPARDFAMMPLQCVPAMIEAYTSDGTERLQILARSIVVSVSVALFEWSTDEMRQFERNWWRMPRGGWEEMKGQVRSLMSRYS